MAVLLAVVGDVHARRQGLGLDRQAAGRLVLVAFRIGRTVAVRIAVGAAVVHQVDVRIGGLVFLEARTHHQEQRRAPAAVDQVMAVRAAGREGGAIAGAHQGLALVGDEGQLAGHDHHELVLVRMPVALRGGGAGLQLHQVDAKLRDAAGVPQRLPAASVDGLGEGIGITGAGHHGDTAQV
jgi:hypothetical protein